MKRRLIFKDFSDIFSYLTTGARWKIVPLLLPGSLSEGPKSRVGCLKTSQILTQTCPPLQCGGHWPVLALRALELAVERAGVGPTGDRRGGGAGLAFQSQVDGGAHAALLQVDALRAALVAQVGRHQQGAGERRLRSEEEKLQGESTPEVEPDFKLSLFEMTSFKMLTSFSRFHATKPQSSVTSYWFQSQCLHVAFIENKTTACWEEGEHSTLKPSACFKTWFFPL